MPDTKPMPTVTTNATTVPIVVAHRVTPTVIASDKALAARWFRSSPGDISAASALEAKMAAEIAAAREAWGVPREAVAALVEAGQGWIDALTLMRSLGTHDPRQRLVVVKLELAEQQMRAALERVKEGGSARE